MIEPTELRTDHLLLRPWSLGDLEGFFAYNKDVEMARYLPHTPQPYKRSDAEEFVASRVLSPWETNPSFAIVMDSTVIGRIRLTIDVADEIAELGYHIARAHWGKGLATEAAYAVVGLGFGKYQLQKVYASTDLRNRGAWRVMEKLGMIREGVARRHGKGRGSGRTDTVHYGILRERWEAVWCEANRT